MKQIDRAILMWHSAGKSHAIIARDYGVSKPYIRQLIEKYAKDGF